MLSSQDELNTLHVVVKRAFSATPAERLQQYATYYVRLLVQHL